MVGLCLMREYSGMSKGKDSFGLDDCLWRIYSFDHSNPPFLILTLTLYLDQLLEDRSAKRKRELHGERIMI